MRFHHLLTTTALLCISTAAWAADSTPMGSMEHAHGDRPPMEQGNGPMGGAEGGQQRPPHPMLSEQQRKSLHDCAKQGGVDLPPPNHEGPPRLSDDQRKVMHACFEKLGIKPPRHPHEAGPGGDARQAGESGHPPMMDNPPMGEHPPGKPPMGSKPPGEKPPAPPAQ